ncbi:MAG: molybdate ABC transporter permease subunit, partial [Ilumatobacteraceae bacterium]
MSGATDTRRVGQRPPAVLVVLAVLAAAFFVLPLIGLLGRAPWGDLGDLVTSDVVLDALRISL